MRTTASTAARTTTASAAAAARPACRLVPVSTPYTPHHDHAAFVDAEATPFGDQNGVRVWRTPDNDGIGLVVVDQPPDLPRAETREAFDEAYRGLFTDARVKLMELGIVKVDGVPTVRSIIATPQPSGGILFVASLTIPFESFAYVFKVQCEERGLKGVRERTVLDRQIAAGLASEGEDGITGEFEPYDAKYDADFPIHPLTRARYWLPRIAKHTLLDKGAKREPRFGLPIE